jgi:hypothetical protein
MVYSFNTRGTLLSIRDNSGANARFLLEPSTASEQYSQTNTLKLNSSLRVSNSISRIKAVEFDPILRLGIRAARDGHVKVRQVRIFQSAVILIADAAFKR